MISENSYSRVCYRQKERPCSQESSEKAGSTRSCFYTVFFYLPNQAAVRKHSDFFSLSYRIPINLFVHLNKFLVSSLFTLPFFSRINLPAKCKVNKVAKIFFKLTFKQFAMTKMQVCDPHSTHHTLYRGSFPRASCWWALFMKTSYSEICICFTRCTLFFRV